MIKQTRLHSVCNPSAQILQCFLIIRSLTIFIVLSLMCPRAFAFADSLSRVKWRFYAGPIISRSFSNYPLKPTIDDVSSTTYKKVDSASPYKAGICLGADLHFFSQKKLSVVLGISFSKSSAEYHSTFTSVGPTSRSGYTTLKRTSENDYSIKFTALNFQAGLRRRLPNNFFISPSFVLTSPIKIERILNGYTETSFSNSSGGEDRDVIYINNEKTLLAQKAANFSFRLQAEYLIQLNKHNLGFYLYRNFGLLYALPWWSFGVSYIL